LQEATWDEALGRASELLGGSGGILASAGLSNEAFWVLEALSARLPAALWPPAGGHWPVAGAIQNLARCKAVVLVGLDVWTELPILALWIRKAVAAGAKLVVLGPQNGLWRDSAHWLPGDPLVSAAALTTALDGRTGPPPEALAAAAALRGQNAVALLVHPALAASARPALDALAAALGVSADDGLVGAPLLGANGRGAQNLAPTLANGVHGRVLDAPAILVVGDEAWADLEAGAAPLIVAATRHPTDDARVEVLLPMAHPYERQATLFNLEGRLQHQSGGAAPPPSARADWGILAVLAQHLQVPVPASLSQIRAAIGAHRPELANELTREVLLARV
jgi:NADH dehydrogenase/NADH:ubiquinone oxidoreductase subunit G